MKHTTVLLMLVAIFATVITRFSNITWGQPYFFHPDERNIASSVSQLDIFNNLNPHFFAYGSLPLYTIFSLGLISNFFSSCHFSFSDCSISFEQAIIISRLLSAFFSCASLLLMYQIGSIIWNKRTAILIVLLGIFSTGFIQFSHFGTFEMWSVFFSLLLCLICLRKSTSQLSLYTLLLGVTTGILISIKISNVVFLPLSLLGMIHITKRIYSIHSSKVLRIRKTVKYFLLFVISILAVYLLSNPFVFLSQQEFLNSFTYERTVATGELPVFYTQEFFGTIPIVYQYLHVFPFLLNPVITILLPIMILGVCLLIKKTRRFEYIFVGLFLLCSFLPQAILFIKWTRNSVISLPYIFLLLPAIRVFIKQKYVFNISIALLLGSSVFFSLSYFTLVFLNQDTRVQAATDAKKLMPTNAVIMSEVYDLGIVPFNTPFPNITLVNTYDMEHDPILFSEFSQEIKQSEYIILPSQRVLKTRLASTSHFPKGKAFYTQLTTSPKYIKIYQTPCALLCKIVYLGDPLLQFEMTASVFDRPVVQIYKKL